MQQESGPSALKTLFLEKGEAQGAAIKNGYEMLVLQAEKSQLTFKRLEQNLGSIVARQRTQPIRD